ncbi:MAG TPA: zinc ribbon domain-containing protein [Candidatus Binataceae bacterium]|nr:zinc ribbon domain-containing protein [Candidatus Binataceae bacterium]
MACSACLVDNAPAARYCRECGSALTGEAHEASSSSVGVWSDRPRRCEECHATIAAGARFCTQCGVSAVTDQSPSNGWLIGAVISVAAAVVTFSTLVVQFYGK